jgi:hypothetical protein
VGAVAVVAVAASACRAEVTTLVEVAGAGVASYTVSARFDGAAAEALTANPALVEQVSETFRSRFAVTSRDRDGEVWVWTASPTADELAAAAGVTGVAGVRAAVSDDRSEVTVVVDVVDPVQLRTAIADGASPEAVVALTDATVVSVAVVMPGGVRSASSASGAPVTVDGTVAELRWRLSAPSPVGAFEVTGSPVAPAAWLPRILLATAAVTAVLVVVVVRRSPKAGLH